ncbi:hepatic lectin-like [Patiria miniata]|uniref:C-type lectin domain-containing protein n=1 Tax=Patiria miniata TaxID=46514 RepID=A0A914B3R9_PATMI|nr:hepatic lectin-like [Patiria miniata]
MLPKRLIFSLISLHLMIRCMGSSEMCEASIRGACPPTWNHWGGRCYKATDERLTWSEAKEECIKMGSVLVVPQSDDETDFLVSLVSSKFWIHCNDLQSEGTWECKDGTSNVRYRNWAREEVGLGGLGRAGSSSSEETLPTPSTGQREDCANVLQTGEWSDVPCDWRRHGICKRPAPQLHF